MGRLCLAWDWNDGRLSNSCGWKWIWEGARIHWCQAPHPCVVLGARVGRETSGCSPVFLPWASQAVGHLPSGVNPSLLSIARKGHFRAEEEKIAVTWPPLSHPKPFTPRGFPWLCSTQGWARRPGYTPAAECMPQSLAAGEAAGKESCYKHEIGGSDGDSSLTFFRNYITVFHKGSTILHSYQGFSFSYVLTSFF